MDYEALKRMPVHERKDTLESIMAGVEETNYMMPLSPGQIDEQRQTLTGALIEKEMIEEDLKQEKERFKLKLVPIQAIIKTALSAVRVGQIPAMGKIYRVPDYERKTMSLIDEHGNHLMTRPMLPNEHQLHINHNIQKAS
jgi:hypothetical protein